MSDANCDVAQESDLIWNIDLFGSMVVARRVHASRYIGGFLINRAATNSTLRFATACVLSVDGLSQLIYRELKSDQVFRVPNSRILGRASNDLSVSGDGRDGVRFQSAV